MSESTYTGPVAVPAAEANAPGDRGSASGINDGGTASGTPGGGAPESATPDHSARNRLVIRLLLVSAFVVILNETIMSVAIPELMKDLRIEASTAQWLTTAFMLTMAIVIPITGYLLERFSTRQVFIAAMSLFTLGTLICAVAPGFAVLLGGRIVQACGTAIMMPLLMTTVMRLVEPARRGRTMGNISIVMSVAPAIGPTISGFILNVLDWRWIFILVLPIAAASLALGLARIRNVSTPVKVPVDVLSVILSAFAFGGLIFGLSSLGEAAAGHAMMEPWIPLTVGGVALAAFVARQLQLQRADRALLDLRTFSIPGFAVPVVLMVIMMAALFGSIIILPLYLQDALGLEPLQTGLLMMPGSLLMGLLGPIVGRLYDRVGPRMLVVPGTIIVSLVLWSLVILSETTPVWFVLTAHVVMCLGLALTFTPLFTASLGSLTPHLISHGSATIGTLQQVAGAAGTALFITVLTFTSAGMITDGAGELTALAGGVRTAFLYGAVISVLAVVGAFFVKRPAAEASHPAG